MIGLVPMLRKMVEKTTRNMTAAITVEDSLSAFDASPCGAKLYITSATLTAPLRVPAHIIIIMSEKLSFLLLQKF
jgi:hypothetical protein